MNDPGFVQVTAGGGPELETILARLEHDFRSVLPVPLIHLVWQEEQDRLVDEPAPDLAPFAAEHAARDRLRGLSGAPGSRR